MVSEAHFSPGDRVLDLGAGNGVLTRELLGAGAVVTAVELHPGRAARLRDRFADDPVEVICASMLSVAVPTSPFRVVANPPYAITTALLHRLMAPESRLIEATLVLQRGVVRDWAGLGERRPPGQRRWSGRFTATQLMALPRRAFQPPPRVDSAVLQLRRRRRRS